jgi:hypothetical protein
MTRTDETNSMNAHACISIGELLHGSVVALRELRLIEERLLVNGGAYSTRLSGQAKRARTTVAELEQALASEAQRAMGA